jgi:hypothetical protein
MNAENEFNSTAGIDQRNGTSGNPWADKQIIDQVRDFQFIKAAVCPGTEVRYI